MNKEFEKKVIREGIVDTKIYRYVYTTAPEGTAMIIKRIELSKLDTTSVYTDWKIIKRYN